MQDQFSGCLTVLEARNRREIEYVPIGGVAVILHGLECLTRDTNILVRPTPAGRAKLRTALQTISNIQPSLRSRRRNGSATRLFALARAALLD